MWLCNMQMIFLFSLMLITAFDYAVASPALAIKVESFTTLDLLAGRRSDDLAKALSTTGILTVSLPSSHEFHLTRQLALQGLCECQDRLSLLPGADVATLNDGITIRNTLATATIGKSPLPLPANELQSVCGKDVSDAMEILRDQVAFVADTFVNALDRLLLGSNSELLRDRYGVTYSSVASIVRGASNLEHFHVYTKNITSNERYMMDNDLPKEDSLSLHTDAGLFLAFVPANSCDAKDSLEKNNDRSFFIQDARNNISPVDFPNDSIAIMLGAGSEHWLQSRFPLRATRHSVKMTPGQSRAWYGMMHLVPESAIIQSSPRRTFGDMKRSMVHIANNQKLFGDYDNTGDLSIGCGNHDKNASSIGAHSTSIQRRRLQTLNDASQCNNVTNFFCWMSCLEIPNHEQAQGYLNEGHSLYCLDPTVLAASGNKVSEAVKPCDGSFHNDKCMGSWQPTAPGVVAAEITVEHDSSISERDEPYCYGGTSMFMDGFHWSNSVCVIFLFPQWVLSSQGHMIGASIVSLLLGLVLEAIIFSRRHYISPMTAGHRRLGTSAFIYGVQMVMGYLLMLVAMTYSGPLFMCVILGLMSGHVLFNAKDAIVPTMLDVKKEKRTQHTEPSCCRTEAAPEDNGGRINKLHNDNFDVPEGGTPCCQNVL